MANYHAVSRLREDKEARKTHGYMMNERMAKTLQNHFSLGPSSRRLLQTIVQKMTLFIRPSKRHRKFFLPMIQYSFAQTPTEMRLDGRFHHQSSQFLWSFGLGSPRSSSSSRDVLSVVTNGHLKIIASSIFCIQQ